MDEPGDIGQGEGGAALGAGNDGPDDLLAEGGGQVAHGVLARHPGHGEVGEIAGRLETQRGVEREDVAIDAGDDGARSDAGADRQFAGRRGEQVGVEGDGVGKSVDIKDPRAGRDAGQDRQGAAGGGGGARAEEDVVAREPGDRGARGDADAGDHLAGGQPSDIGDGDETRVDIARNQGLAEGLGINGLADGEPGRVGDDEGGLGSGQAARGLRGEYVAQGQRVRREVDSDDRGARRDARRDGEQAGRSSGQGGAEVHPVTDDALDRGAGGDAEAGDGLAGRQVVRVADRDEGNDGPGGGGVVDGFDDGNRPDRLARRQVGHVGQGDRAGEGRAGADRADEEVTRSDGCRRVDAVDRGAGAETGDAGEANRVGARGAPRQGDAGVDRGRRLQVEGGIGVGRGPGEVGERGVELGDLAGRLADDQGAAVEVDGRPGLAEERPNGLVARGIEGRAGEEHETGGVLDAVRAVEGEGALLDDGRAVVGVQAGEGQRIGALLDEVARARDLALVGRGGVLIQGDAAAAELDAGVGVADEVVDALRGVVEADGGLVAQATVHVAVTDARLQLDRGGVHERVVLTEGEGQRDAVADDEFAEEEVLPVVDVDHAELAVADGGVAGTGVDDGVRRGHGQDGAGGAVDLRPERAGVVLDDGEGAGGAQHDAAVAEALHVRDDLAAVDVDLADGRAGAHQRKRANALLVEDALAAVDAARVVTVEVRILDDDESLVRRDIDAGTGAGTGVPEVDGGFRVEGLQVADRLVATHLEDGGAASGEVARAPLSAAALVVGGVEFRQRGLPGRRAADEVDGGGLTQGEAVGVVEHEVAAGDEDVAGETAAVQDGQLTGAGLEQTTSAVDAADGTDHAGVEMGVKSVVIVFADLEDGVDVGPLVAGHEVEQGAGVKVVDEIQAENQRRGGVPQLAVAQLRALADDVVRGILEAERGVALHEDGLGADHARGEAHGGVGAILGPLVEVAADDQRALVDNRDAREGALGAQVVGQVGVIGEGVVAEVIDVLEGIVLEGAAAGLDEQGDYVGDRQVGHREGGDRGEVVAEQLDLGGRGDLLVDDELGADAADGLAEVQRGDRAGQLLDLRRARQGAGGAEVGQVDDAREGRADEHLRRVGLRRGVVDGDVGPGEGGGREGGGQDEEAAGEFHCGKEVSGTIRSDGGSRPRSRWSGWNRPSRARSSGNRPCRGSDRT